MIGIILQARMNSSRLPGKVLMDMGGVPMLEYILKRLDRIRTPRVYKVVATTDTPDDNPIAALCERISVPCFRGSENNVLQRYFQCAVQYKMDLIVRLTGDNPFVDVEEVDALIEKIRTDKADYVHSFSELPHGVGAEVFTAAALETCYKKSSLPHHFEHVNEYILENPEQFQIMVLKVPERKRKPDIRLTVDTEDDYKRGAFIANHSSGSYISTEEAVQLCLQYA